MRRVHHFVRIQRWTGSRTGVSSCSMPRTGGVNDHAAFSSSHYRTCSVYQNSPSPLYCTSELASYTCRRCSALSLSHTKPSTWHQHPNTAPSPLPAVSLCIPHPAHIPLYTHSPHLLPTLVVLNHANTFFRSSVSMFSTILAHTAGLSATLKSCPIASFNPLLMSSFSLPAA